MNRHAKNFLQGMAELWPLSPSAYLPPNGGGYAQDRRAMRGDQRCIAQDMRRALNKYEQTSADSR